MPALLRLAAWLPVLLCTLALLLQPLNPGWLAGWLLTPAVTGDGSPGCDCGVSLRRGRRTRMEDRARCKISLCNHTSNPLGFMAVLDGHDTEAAVKLATNQLEDQLCAALLKQYRWWTGRRQYGSAQVERAVKTAVQATDALLVEQAVRHNTTGGTTLALALLVGRQALIASVGDSKALVCRKATAGPPPSIRQQPASTVSHHKRLWQQEELHSTKQEGMLQLSSSGAQTAASSSAETGSTVSRPALQALVLTKDHSPGRPDERRRIEAAGGSVVQTSPGRHRLQGELAVSRALGDAEYRRFGLIADPVVAWYSFQPADEMLILATDGLFETMSPDEVCQTAGEAAAGAAQMASPTVAQPIPLGPDAIPAGSFRPAYHVSQQLPPHSAEPGLYGCQDCCMQRQPADANPCPGGPQQPYTLQQAIAARLVQEAYLRSSMDNIAAVVMPVGFMLRQVQQADTELVSLGANDKADQQQTEVTGGAMVASIGAQHRYELLQRMVTLPHGKRQTQLAIPAARCQARSAQGDVPDTALAQQGSSGLEVSFNPTLLHDPSERLQLGPAETALIKTLAAVPVHGPSHWQHQQLHTDGNPDERTIEVEGYDLAEQFGRGSFGEVWKAVRHDVGIGSKWERWAAHSFVLKRIMTEKGMEVRLSGAREAYFGDLLRLPEHAHTCIGPCTKPAQRGFDHIVRFVESFQAGADLWLVFRDEDASTLHDLMYKGPPAAHPGKSRRRGRGQLSAVQPSAWWRQLRGAGWGEAALRSILRQTLQALATLHSLNITHRDVKPENLLLQQRPSAKTHSHHHKTLQQQPQQVQQHLQQEQDREQKQEEEGEEALELHLRLIDFGSAVDPHSMQHLYGLGGPSSDQQTMEFAPPECVFGSYWTGSRTSKRTWPYDIWSVGVVWLELILGTPQVFQISARTQALLHHRLHLDAKPQAEQQQVYLLRALMELCIYPPHRRADYGGPGGAAGAEGVGIDQPQLPVAWSCTDDAIMEVIRQRDPTHQGLPSRLALRLLLSLLSWNPAERPTAVQALNHAFFVVDLEAHSEHECPVNAMLATPGWC